MKNLKFGLIGCGGLCPRVRCQTVVSNMARAPQRRRSGSCLCGHPPHPNLHLPLIEDFTNAVIEDREPAVDGKIGYEVQRLEDEIYAGN